MMNKFLFNIITLTCLWTSQCFAQNWSPVGPGIGCNNTERVHEININSDSSMLLIAGFINRDGNCNPMRSVLTYDGIQYQQTAESLIGSESTLAFEYNGKIYGSGFFVSQLDPNMDFNVKTEEGIWDTVPNGFNGSARDYIIHDNIVYMAGGFSTCGGIPCGLVCSFDGQQVLPYYTGSPDNDIAHCVEFYKDTLYVGGVFTGNDGLHAQGYNDCCKIVNGQLEKVAQGFPVAGVFYDLEVYDDKLYMGGWAPTFGNSEWHTIYYYENGQLYTLPSEPDFTVTAMKAYNGGLYVAGDFSNIGEMPCNRIARWDGQTWTCLNNDVFYYQNDNPCVVECIKDIEIWNDTLYIGGRFHRIGDTELRRIAKLDMALSEAFPTSVQEQQRKAELLIYPNPTSDFIHVKPEKTDKGKARIEIVDARGSLVLQKNTTLVNNEVLLDIKALASGLYTLRYISDEYSLTQSFVKE